MLRLLPIVALAVGILLGMQLMGPVTGASGQYLAVACLAGLDTVCGGIRSGLEGKFHSDVFVTGFISNVLIAFFIGGIETLGLIGDRFGLSGWFWEGIAALNDNFNGLGFAIIGLFVVAWILSIVIYRYHRLDDIELRG